MQDDEIYDKYIAKVKSYDIWIEGHIAQGSSSGASLIGTAKAESFKEACKIFSETPEAKGWGNYDSNENSFWGCHLYNNGQDARRGFG